jgi:hypothetical protein
MRRIDEEGVRESVRDLFDGSADVLEILAEALQEVAGHQNDIMPDEFLECLREPRLRRLPTPCRRSDRAVALSVG